MTLARRVLSGTGLLAASHGLVRVLSFVTMPILTRLLAPESYGEAALAGTVVSLASVLALAGVDTTYLRTYRSATPPRGADAEQYCWRFAIATSAAAALIAGVAWPLLRPSPAAHDALLAVVVALAVPCSVLGTLAQVRALVRERQAAMARAVVLTGIAGAAASIALAYAHAGALALVVPLALGPLLTLAMLGAPEVARIAARSSLSRAEGRGLIAIGLAGVVTAPMYWLLSSADRWFLEHYRGATEVGVYAVGCSVAVAGMLVNAAVMTIWQPEATREYEEHADRAPATLGRLMSRLAAAMAIVWLAVVAAGGDVVRWLADERFHAAAEFVPWIAGGVYFYGILRLATTGLLLARSLAWSAAWWLAGGVVCVLLNLVLVPVFGATGAAATQVASFAFIAAGTFATAQAKCPLRLEWGRLAATGAVVAAAALVLVPAWHASGFASLLMKLPVGVAVASAVAWLAAPDWCAQAVARVRNRRTTG